MKLFGGGHSEEQVPEPAGPTPETQETPVVTRWDKPVRVAIVDDDEEVRFVLRIALEAGGFEVAGDAGDAEAAMSMIASSQPDIVLLDLHMPDIGGLEILPLIYEDAPLTKVVVISAISATYMTEAALKEGAWGYIVKGVSAKTITEHLKRVTETGAVRPVRPYPLSRDYESRDLSSTPG